MFRFKTVSERKAVVDEPISPYHAGRVRFQGSWWSARCSQNVTLDPGTVVYVVGNQGITLLVEPTESLDQEWGPVSYPQGTQIHREVKPHSLFDHSVAQ
ncbi:MAG: hypothetical protein Kow00121_45620 [Elainellaceae cyanobacterium]